MMKKIMQSAAVLALGAGLFAASAQDAEARRGGVAAGLAIGTILGLGLGGAYVGPHYHDDDDEACYPGPRECGYVGRNCWFNRYGERVCRGGRYRCWRPTICD